MIKILLAYSLLLSIFLHAQVKFESGYVITNDGEKKEVLIKNSGWISNPDTFEYKIDNNAAILNGNLKNTKEFGIYGAVKYVKYTGIIDLSSENINSLSNTYQPDFKEETVFLKELISGSENLYLYEGKSLRKYFYSNSESDIRPLIYKKYNPEGDQYKIAVNDTYLNQLKEIFKNNSDATSMIFKTQYNTNSLTKIFDVYNRKTSVSYNSEVKPKTTSLKFNLNIRPGINFYSALKMSDVLNSEQFPSKTGFRFGLEAELLLPFNKNKWAIIFEPTYSFYTNNKTSVSSDDQLYSVNMDSYSFINIPLGVRHYIYINDKSKFFINANINVATIKTGKAKNINTDYEGYTFNTIELASSQIFESFSFGLGYNYKRFHMEARYNTYNQIIKNDRPQTAKFNYTSIILGYSIF